MRDADDVVLVVREAQDGFQESCTPLRDRWGQVRRLPSREVAEKVAARLTRTGMITPSAYLRGTTFHAGWLPREENNR
jgi:hypothetical protein